MGDLAVDTAVEGGEGSWTATLSADWEIWGPNGGYVAAVALRAAGAHTALPRPASLLCHFLGVARFAPVQITTTTLRGAKRAESVRVSITQEGAPVAEAMVWAVDDDLGGLEHDVTRAPQVPGPHDLVTPPELDPAVPRPGFAFGRNVEQRPVAWVPPAERTAHEPELLSWMRLRPTPVFADPWADACRSVVLVDTYMWPAAASGYAPGTLTHQAPSLDLAVSFHAPGSGSEWLLVDAQAPLAAGGLVAGRSALWSEQGQLVASGGQQMLCRPLRRG